MAELSPAKALLLAVQATSKPDLSTLRTLVSQHRRHLTIEIVLRILLTHLPESLDSVAYVPFLEDLIEGKIESESAIDISALEELSEDQAAHKARKLHLLPLAWPHHPADIPSEPLVLFLIHRSLRIDENTGSITQIPALLEPFLQHSLYLQAWLINTVLPLLRLDYEYHPEESTGLSISKFEKMDDRTGLNLLLSRTGRDSNIKDHTVGRDLRGLVGPWMYGDNRMKRRKLLSLHHQKGTAPLEHGAIHHEKHLAWEEVFKWITEQATISWQTAAAAIEDWDGPGDVDTGGYSYGSAWLAEEDEQYLELRYARSILASAYLVSEASIGALEGVHRILSRLINLLDEDRIPSLEQAGVLLQPIPRIENELLSTQNATLLRNHLLEDQNIITKPRVASIHFLHALLISAYLCTKARSSMSIKRAGELALLQEEGEQIMEFKRLLVWMSNGPKGDDKYWIKCRNEILWLRNWGAEELEEGLDGQSGRGIFGKLSREFIERELLEVLLDSTRYTLSRSIYESAPDLPLDKGVLRQTILASAMHAYDNASNPNKTRGGVKKALEIITSFPDTLQGSDPAKEMESLIKVTHAIGEYKLVFKQGEPFKPVSLRVHPDPISIIGKILDQNPGSYSKIQDFLTMGREMVHAGLKSQPVPDKATSLDLQNKSIKEHESIAEKRVVSMCIDAALAEDDFETAYSYVVTRLKDVGGPAHARSPEPVSSGGLISQPHPKVIDDWSWRAALQAGKYRRSSSTLKPSHLGNTSANPEIRHLEQRMECLSQALRLAPKSTLQEILNVYRRCEEELESQYKQEAEQEEAWDTQGDNSMPGGFGPTAKGPSKSSRAAEEAPMSLFDLSRASMARAQSGFSSLALARNTQAKPTSQPAARASGESERVGTPDSGTHVRKRDQLRNAAVGGLASGVGWILGAPPITNDIEEPR